MRTQLFTWDPTSKPVYEEFQVLLLNGSMHKTHKQMQKETPAVYCFADHPDPGRTLISQITDTSQFFIVLGN